MRVHQLNITYLPEEDRMHFKINTMDQEEFGFLFTRRFVKMLLPVFVKKFEEELTKAVVDTPQSKKAIMEFEHESAVSQTNFTKDYHKAKHYPLGEAPMLVHAFQMKPGPNNAIILCFIPKDKKGIEIGLDPKTLHSFYQLLTQTVKAAEWNLEMPFTEMPQTVAPAEKNKLN